MVASSPQHVSGSSTLRHPGLPRSSRQVNHLPANNSFSILTTLRASCNYFKMSINNNAQESTPLLRGHDGAEESGEAPHASTWQRVKSWVSSHTVNLILTALLAVFVILFLVTAFIQVGRGGDEDEPPSEPSPGEGAEICTSAGCVLAASTLLRSISSRWAYPLCNTDRTLHALTQRPDTRILTHVMTSARMLVRVSMPSTRSGKTRPALAVSRS